MHLNYEYQIKIAQKISKNRNNAKILDFGCASGIVVLKGRKMGLNIYGADINFETLTKEKLNKLNYFGDIIKETKNGILDFDDNYFDLIMCNMVFEHIKELEPVLNEIFRVLRDDGFFLCIFPSKECIYESHLGIPFINYFSKKSRFRFYLVLLLRSLGFGNYKENYSKKEWTIVKLDSYDKNIFYLTKKEIQKLFSGYFKYSFIEHDYLAFRLNKRKIFRFLFKIPSILFILKILFQKIAFLSILATKNKIIT